MSDNRLLDLVDSRDFRTLFIDELGWENPKQPATRFDIDGQTFTFSQLAGYKGMRVWHCPVLPARKVQRALDVLVGQSNQERLLIFSSPTRQDWRWPRRAQLGGTNAKLLAHEHVVGDRSTHLTQRLRAIELDFDEDLSLVALLEKMRDAFDHEAETASVAAARMMGTLYTELETAGVGEYEATLLLARLLFLMFGDDTDMWQPENAFHRWIEDHTTPESLHTSLTELFDVLNNDTPDRHLPSGSPYERFRYINGGLFADPLRLPSLPGQFRDAVIEACEFNWSVISPAVFGSMFQTVKSREARRHGGEHYTTEENILKTIGPLFLDEYRERLDRAWDDKAQLTKLHNDLGKLRFLDPACGCGNFLIIAYRELRALELEILKRRRDLDLVDGKASGGDRWQMSFDVSGDLRVRLDHFYGIEIEEWPARIAETAMLLVDHLANQRMTEEFGIAPDRLPIRIAPTIRHANALHTDWATLVPPSDDVVLLGNPPFVGISLRTPAQTADLQSVWGGRYHGTLDYVTGWYAKALDYFHNYSGRWAFVSTNSVTQGEAVAPLFDPIFNANWRIRFAHRTFKWTTEARDGAAVHCVIIGFAKSVTKPRLFDYLAPDAEPTELQVRGINPYLTEGSPIIVRPSTRPISSQMGEVIYGNKPTDNGQLIVEPIDYANVMADAIAAKYVRRYVGARELLHDRQRHCLWLADSTPEDRQNSQVLRERVAAVRQFRSESPAPSTRQAATTAHLFRQTSQPDISYLCIPRHVSENRPYFLSARFEADVICSDANFLSTDPDGFVFAVISSTMFITWQKAVGGRIKSDLRFNKLLTWNTFPLPQTSPQARGHIVAAGESVREARAALAGSLAEMYDPTSISSNLIAAHTELDRLVDKLFGRIDVSTPARREKVLFQRYAALTGQETLL